MRFLRWWTEKPDRWMIALLVLLAFAKGLLWVATFPVFKIADEPAHFDNVQYRAEHHQWAPVATRALEKVMSSTASPEMRLTWTAAQKYHREKHSQYVSMVNEEPKLTLLAKDEKNRLTDGQMPALMYPGVYYSMATVPYLLLQTRSLLNRVYAVRALSMLFGLCAVLASFFAARATFDQPELAFAAACVVCMQPMFSQQTAAVNNDAALIGWCAIAFALQVMLLAGRPRATILYGLLIGLTVGLSIYSKPQGWLMMFTGFLVFVRITLALGRAAWRLWAGAAAACVVVMLVTAMWPTAPPPPSAPVVAAVVPSPAPAKAAAPPVEDGPITQLVTELIGFPSWVDHLDADYRDYLFRSAFGQFSWLEFSIPAYWTASIKDLLPICFAGLIIALVLRLVRPEPRFWATAPAALAAITMFCDIVGVLFVEYHVRAGRPFAGVIQGRNFLFAMPAFGVLVMLGLASMVPRKLRGLTAAMVVTGSICLNLGALVCIVRQHYGG